jgi:gas vesicle protein
MMNERTYYSREAEERAQMERTMLAALVLAFGLGVGAAIMLLFAPRTGEKTRKVLADQVGHVYEKGGEATNSALDGLRKEFDHLRSDVEDRLKHLQS